MVVCLAVLPAVEAVRAVMVPAAVVSGTAAVWTQRVPPLLPYTMRVHESARYPRTAKMMFVRDAGVRILDVKSFEDGRRCCCQTVHTRYPGHNCRFTMCVRDVECRRRHPLPRQRLSFAERHSNISR